MMLDDFGDASRPYRAPTKTATLGAITPWSMPLRENVKELEIAFEEVMQLNDAAWATYMAIHLVDQHFVANMSLRTIQQRVKTYLQVLRKHKLRVPEVHGMFWLEVTEKMMDLPNPAPVVLTNEDESTGGLLLMGKKVTEGVWNYFRGDSPGAIKALTEAIVPLQSIPGVASTSQQVFYLGLALLASCPRATLRVLTSSVDQTLPDGYDAAVIDQRLKEADAEIEKMSLWAERAPHNYRHKLDLMQAERNRVCMFSHRGEHQLMLSTVTLYQSAIDGAQENRFDIEAALATELLGRFYHDCGTKKFAHQHLREAVAMYEDVDARMKYVS